MPRLGMGMPIVSSVSSAPVVAIDDFVFLNDVSGELTPNSTAVRKNLLVQSQTFKTTWATNAAAVIPNDLFRAPDSTLTAQAITSNSAGAQVFIQQTVATTTGETYTYSTHVKKAANGFVLLMFSDGTTVRSAYFNADTGSVGSASNIISTNFQKLDDDWRRVSITFQADSTTSSSFVRIFSAAASGSTGTGAAFQAGTELLYIWGAQLEEDSRPSNYIVTTNAAVTVAAIFGDVSEVWDFDGTDIMLEASFSKDEGAFDRATQNLVLNGDYEELSSDLIVNGDFTSGGSNWGLYQTGSSTVTFPDVASINIDGSNNNVGLFQENVFTNAKTYKIVLTMKATANFIAEVLESQGAATVSSIGQVSLTTSYQDFTFYFKATGTNDLFIHRLFGQTAGQNQQILIKNVLVKESDPNDRWVSEADWTIEDGIAKGNGASGSSEELRQDGILTVGDTYEFTFTIQGYSSGSVELMNNGLGSLSSNGTHTGIGVATSTDLRFRGSSFYGSIDNVTVKEYAITPLNV
jgi:hypothetical protein